MSRAEIADKLAEARKLIERGWTQGDYKCGSAVCSLGAINTALTGEADLEPHTTEWHAVTGALRMVIERFDIVDWNDAPERTQAEVIEAFKRAEQIARGEA